MGTIIHIAEATLRKAVEPVEFEFVFQAVQDELMSKWQSQYSDLSDEEILIKCRGELYKMLTVSGKFARTVNGLWTINQ